MTGWTFDFPRNKILIANNFSIFLHEVMFPTQHTKKQHEEINPFRSFKGQTFAIHSCICFPIYPPWLAWAYGFSCCFWEKNYDLPLPAFVCNTGQIKRKRATKHWYFQNTVALSFGKNFEIKRLPSFLKVFSYCGLL